MIPFLPGRGILDPSSGFQRTSWASYHNAWHTCQQVLLDVRKFRGKKDLGGDYANTSVSYGTRGKEVLFSVLLGTSLTPQLGMYGIFGSWNSGSVYDYPVYLLDNDTEACLGINTISLPRVRY